MPDGCCYICNECPNSYTTLEDLELHLRDHLMQKIKNENGESKHLEAIEEKPISTMQDDDIDTPNSPSSSEHSDSQIDIDASMDDASESLHENDLKPGHYCRFCPSQFDDQSQLNIHYTHTHRDKPQYPCDHCGVIFGVKRELATHMRTHSGEQPHTCTQCGKEFGTRQLLKKHWMWHTGERSHQCPHCNKAFFQKGHLTQHLMIHAGGRPHQCKLCQKTFIFKFDLNRHMKIHAERGFSCQHCGKAFARQSQLEEHTLLKCKGLRSASSAGFSSPPQQSPGGGKMASARRQSTPAIFPVAPQPILPFSADDINKMAQTLLLQQQQRTFASLFAAQQQNQVQQQRQAPPPQMTFEQPIPQVPCLLCAQRFPSQTSLLLHISAFHMSNGMLSHNLQPKIMGQASQQLPTQLSVFTPVKPIKTESEDLHAGSSAANSATNSSCASSPLKVSPSSCEGSSSDVVNVSPTSLSRNESESPEPKEHKSCTDCVRIRSRADELESELEKQKDELERAKNALKQVSTLAQQIGAFLPVDPQSYLSTQNMFTKIESVLRGVDCV